MPDPAATTGSGHVARWRGALRGGWLAAVVVALAFILIDRWGEVGPSLDGLSASHLAGAGVAGLAGVGFSAGIWRALLAGLGSALPVSGVSRVFFVGQLGKYLPGSVWPAVAQMELGRDWAVPPRVSAAAVVLFLWVHLLSGAIVALFALVAVGLLPTWVLLGAPVAAGLLWPTTLGPVLSWGLRLARRAPLPSVPDGAAVATAFGWALAMWASYGLHLLFLVDGVGGQASLVGAAGAFAAAWCAGFLFIVAPAGAGAREGALILSLPMLTTGAAVGVAVVSRLLLTAADALWGTIGVLVRRRT